MKVRVIIADDEPLARERVKSFLNEETDIEIIAECADGEQTLAMVQQHRPDLLFLDVQMPRLNGFEVLEALGPAQLPAVIFTTAHDQHALRAFEVNALDYLLKPWSEQRFKKTLQRAREQLQQRTNQLADPKLAALLSQLNAERRNSPGGYW